MDLATRYIDISTCEAFEGVSALAARSYGLSRLGATNTKEVDVHKEVERQWWTVRELQMISGLGRTKCYELIASGELEAIKAGRAVRVSRASFEAWTERQRYLNVVTGE
jgi:excisionase family DNA binding protein